MKLLYFLFLLIPQQAFCQFAKVKFSVKLNKQYRKDLKDSSLDVIIVGNRYLRTFTIKPGEIRIFDSVPSSGVSAFVDCTKIYDSLNVIKNFNSYYATKLPKNELVKMKICFPVTCKYDKNIKK